MNWIKKTLQLGEKIKRILKKRPSKEDIENSDWTNCCKGPILKTDLEKNLWVCDTCGKHHRISSRQRFDIIFGKDNYQVFETPIPAEDPLNWKDTKSYKDRLKAARKKTNQNCAVLIASGNLNGINVTAAAINFDFISLNESLSFFCSFLRSKLTNISLTASAPIPAVKASSPNSS